MPRPDEAVRTRADLVMPWMSFPNRLNAQNPSGKDEAPILGSTDGLIGHVSDA